MAIKISFDHPFATRCEYVKPTKLWELVPIWDNFNRLFNWITWRWQLLQSNLFNSNLKLPIHSSKAVKYPVCFLQTFSSEYENVIHFHRTYWSPCISRHLSCCDIWIQFSHAKKCLRIVRCVCVRGRATENRCVLTKHNKSINQRLEQPLGQSTAI